MDFNALILKELKRAGLAMADGKVKKIDLEKVQNYIRNSPAVKEQYLDAVVDQLRKLLNYDKHPLRKEGNEYHLGVDDKLILKLKGNQLLALKVVLQGDKKPIKTPLADTILFKPNGLPQNRLEGIC